jgi:hypothetical protein
MLAQQVVQAKPSTHCIWTAFLKHVPFETGTRSSHLRLITLLTVLLFATLALAAYTYTCKIFRQRELIAWCQVTTAELQRQRECIASAAMALGVC